MSECVRGWIINLFVKDSEDHTVRSTTRYDHWFYSVRTRHGSSSGPVYPPTCNYPYPHASATLGSSLKKLKPHQPFPKGPLPGNLDLEPPRLPRSVSPLRSVLPTPLPQSRTGFCPSVRPRHDARPRIRLPVSSDIPVVPLTFRPPPASLLVSGPTPRT